MFLIKVSFSERAGYLDFRGPFLEAPGNYRAR